MKQQHQRQKDKHRRHEMSYRSQFDSNNESTLAAIRFSNFYLKQVAMFVFSLLVDDRLLYAERQIHAAWCRGGVATSYTILYLSWHGCEVSQHREMCVCFVWECVSGLFTNETLCKTICTEQSEICFIKYKSYADILTFVIIQLNLCIVCANYFGFIK